MIRTEQALVHAIEAVAVLGAAFSGFAEARNKKMDAVGVFTIAFVTAFGGGTLRDLLLDRRPFYWVQNYEYVVIILVLTLVAAPLLRFAQRVVPLTAFVTADAIGLGFFSIAGCAISNSLGMPWIIAALVGVITGVAGGVLRDVILNEVPVVFRDGKPYALVAFIGCLAYLVMLNAGTGQAFALWSAAAITVGFRLAAWHADWRIS